VFEGEFLTETPVYTIIRGVHPYMKCRSTI